MKKSNVKERGLMRISEVSKITGVSLPTIHYYAREGLLFPSIKTARNMAYYSPDCIDDIRLIKELQSKRFLPLSAIKLIMNARREGQDTDHLIEMQSFLDDIFHPIEAEGYNGLTFNELIAASGLSTTDLKSLEALGLLMPAETAQGRFYDDIDVRIAQIVRELAEFGLEPADLSVYRQYVEAIRIEAKTIHAKIHATHGTDKVPLTRLGNVLNRLKSYLANKIYRQLFLEEHK